jgi:hypothetical protein
MNRAEMPNDGTVRGELLERARAQYLAGEVAQASQTCVRLAELSRAAGAAATLADAAVVVRRPLDPVVRAQMHALAVEALAALGDGDPVRSARVSAQLEATRDPFHADEPPRMTRTSATPRRPS